MLVAITGTPGTGKSSLCRGLAGHGWRVLEVLALAREAGCVSGSEDGSELVDVERLAAHVSASVKGDAVIDGHLSHRLPVDLAIVLRCRPGVLAERLAPRGYPEAKLRENVEAEAVDVVLVEAVEALGVEKVYEVDTTLAGEGAVLEATLGILAGRGGAHRPGKVDWSEEVMAWY